MKIAVIGAGAMGSVIGGLLAKAGNDVMFIEVSEAVVGAINGDGLRIQSKTGEIERIAARATSKPETVGPVDLVLVFVKCYHTEAAIRAAQPLVGAHTRVLSLQNGWGNGPRIAGIVGDERVLLGVCYHSATVLGPGHVRHGGQGATYIGRWMATEPPPADVAGVFTQAGVATSVAENVIAEIWSKLALNVCTLPTSALLRLEANQLVQHQEVMDLMAALLREVTQVAAARNIPLDYDERWASITGLLGRCGPGAKSSMLQDVEAKRRTEIDVINGAIVEAGREFKIPTPYNDTMLWLIKAWEKTLPL